MIFILVSMDVTSLYTNIPQEEGIEVVCKAYENSSTIITLRYLHVTFLNEMLGFILKGNSFQFNGENFLQTQGTATGTNMAVSFANIFMAEIERRIIQQNNTKPRGWKRYNDDIFSL